jgi:ABC-type phosphate/phosphonate transport system substrate-binding protein
MTDMSLAVCPHDTVRNSEGWFRLVQYLSQKLATNVHFSLSLDFADFHERFSASDLVYANPSDAIKLIDGHGYTPLARPTEVYDEALLVAGPDGPTPPLAALTGAPLATITAMLPTKIGLRLLDEQGVVPGSLVNCDSWLSVVRSVWGGDTPYGIIYRDAYEELSPQGRAMVQVIATSDCRCAFHVLCAGPQLAAQAGALSAAMLGMADDALGQEVLADMKLPGWQAVTAEQLDLMRGILAA